MVKGGLTSKNHDANISKQSKKWILKKFQDQKGWLKHQTLGFERLEMGISLAGTSNEEIQ